VARRIAYTVVANAHALSGQYDIIHYQNYYVPRTRGRARKVVTIHDVASFRLPETVPVIYRKYNQATIRNAVERAHGVVVPSAFTRREVLDLFPWLDGEKVFVCPNGIRKQFLSPDANAGSLAKFGLEPYSYYFSLGVLTKRKNFRFLLETFALARKMGRISRNTALILAGKGAWDTHEIRPLIDKELGIHLLGYVHDEDMPALYRYSKAFVFPSLYEGFGIPIIEAMSQQTPIIASDIPGTRELDEQHNRQIHFFPLGGVDELMMHLAELDAHPPSSRSQLSYGDLALNDFPHVARRHLDVYDIVLASAARGSTT
jgi:alpha-1,3-rhamnosyl/mannosyltransferase